MNFTLVQLFDLGGNKKNTDKDGFQRLTVVFVEVTMTAWGVVSALFSKPVEPMPQAAWTFIRCVTDFS